MRIRNIALVAVLSLSLPAALTTPPAYGQAAQATAQELYESGIELYKAGKLQEAQTTLRKVDPLQLPREVQENFYNTLFEIDQKLNAAAPADEPATDSTPETTDAQPEAPADEPAAPPKADPASLLRQADAMAAKNMAQALSVYQEVAASDDASPEQKATANARIAGIERRMNQDVTSARQTITLAEQDIVNGDLDAAKAKLISVKNSGVELGFFDSESVNKKLLVIAEIREAEAAAAAAAAAVAEADKPEAPTPRPEPGATATAADAELAAAKQRAKEAEAAKAEAQAKLAAMQRKLAEQENVSPQAPVSDLMVKARANTAAEKAEQGDKALRNGQLSAAVEFFADAVLLDPDNATYQEKLDNARAQLNEQMRPLDILDQNAQELVVDLQRARAEYEAAMQAAGKALENKDFQAANDSAIQARTVLSSSRGVFNTAEYNERTARAISLQNAIDETRRFTEAQQLDVIEQKRREEEARVAAETKRRKNSEIQSRVQTARALQREQKYPEALAEIDAALFLDPNNAILLGLRDMIQDSAIAVDAHRKMRDRRVEMAKLRLLNIEATTPYTDLLTYPGEWPELTAMRLRSMEDSSGESEANRTAQAALRKIVTLSNDNLSLDQVIAFIRDTTGANIAVNWPALDLVGIDQESLVTISLNRVPAEQLLRLVLDQVSADAFEDDKAGFTVSEGIVKISTLRDLKSETETRVYDIRDLLVQVPNFQNAPGFDINDALSNTSSGGSNGGGGGGGGEGLFGGDDSADQDEDLPTREELVDQITELITTTVGDPDEWLDEESTLTELNGNMIIKTTSDNHRQIVGLLGRLRETRAVQISVEARFLTVENNFLDEFLVDFDITLDAGNEDLVDNRSPFVDIEDNFYDANTPDSATQVDGLPDGVPDLRPDGRPDNGANQLPVVIGNNGSALASRTPTGAEVANSWSAVAESAFGFGYSFIDDIAVDLILNATQANQNRILLNAPRITFFNGQRAYVMVATQTAFVSDLEPIPDAIGFDPTISVFNTGVVLDVEGTISSDRRYVTMTLRPSLAIPAGIDDFVIGGAGTVTGGGNPVVVNLAGTIQVPTIRIQQVRSTVSIPDRGTLVIGGQKLVGEIDQQVGVPVLSKLPVINRLFTQTTTIKDEQTLLILVRPTIIIQSEQEDVLFPGLNDDPEGYNVGAFTPLP